MRDAEDNAQAASEEKVLLHMELLGAQEQLVTAAASVSEHDATISKLQADIKVSF